jgi:hypothetical protein
MGCETGCCTETKNSTQAVRDLLPWTLCRTKRSHDKDRRSTLRNKDERMKFLCVGLEPPIIAGNASKDTAKYAPRMEWITGRGHERVVNSVVD